MKPISLGGRNGEIMEHPEFSSGDNDKFGACIGIHNVCNGLVYTWSCSPVDRVISCEGKGCSFRIVVEQEIDTPNKLSGWCAEHLNCQDAQLDREIWRRFQNRFKVGAVGDGD